ncbi:YggS family pyridoxal phosphate-dependent enzyme [candidate division TA06 bacterium]|uniref:Pyridoxal phosphate homeostasis protein n=1 Tax=candidate division TA06 bacterium TaxID=2250710 RepID=A0A660SAL3_UNCT6|nr:MAG: YggS family pyridoxal phosphate-dependent enzyme [candidate division TA06 bacterium]
MGRIRENVERILNEIPDYVRLEIAAKTRSAEEIREAIDAGVHIIGENYIKDVKKVYPLLGKIAQWHFIGSPDMQKHDLLKNKYLEIFDMIETVDSEKIAIEINEKCKKIGKTMDVLIEVNSGREVQKSGVMPEDTLELVKKLGSLENIRIKGLMTMGPRLGNPEDSRPFFKETKRIFDEIKKLNMPGVEMKYLSMGMSNSYKIAISEGANIIRLGTVIFGPREL